MKKDAPSSAFLAAIERAALALKARDFSSSRQIIADAMAMNMDAPEPHNLLGIFYELLGDDGAARQHYRAAYALDPTYKPSCRNLERLALYGFNATNSCDYGVFAVKDQDVSAL
jgi:Flp pilus assembly protein TadD